MYTHTTVCRDLEFRVNNNGDAHEEIVEVCINDEWYQATSAKVANTSQSSQDVSVTIADSTSVMIKWSKRQSIPSSDKNISEYDLSCTTSSLSAGQIHEMRILNISTSTTEITVNGLLPGTAYECCVSAHIQTNTPLDLITTSCVATSTKTIIEEPSYCNDCLAIGLGSGIGTCSLLLLLVVSIQVGYIVIKRSCLKRDSTMQVNTLRYEYYRYLATHKLSIINSIVTW